MWRALRRALVVLGITWSAAAAAGRDAVPEKGSLDCEALDPCADVLPGATRFERTDEQAYATGYDAKGERVGWVVLSNDVVDVKGYSGKPLSTLVGLDGDGVITGARVVHHTEPILLVGIPEQKLHDFVDSYAGIRADARVVVGGGKGDELTVDVVSGATVTVLAENETLLGAARALGSAVGVIERQVAREGAFVVEQTPWSWAQIVDEGALGHLHVGADEMDVAGDRAFLDLWFGFADAPQVGIPLLGERIWQRARDALQPGEHMLVVFNDGTTSFKGSGFVRGGIFDRFRLEQGLSGQTFRDLDYTTLQPPPVADAPRFREGGLFLTRNGSIDPGEPLDMVFLASEYDTSKGAFNRDFKSFDAAWQAPRSVYRTVGLAPAWQMVQDAWTLAPVRTALVTLWLLLAVALFAGRRWLTADLARLKKIHIGYMAGSFVGLGLVLGVQPSVTQVLTGVGAVVGEWRWSLFLSDPVVFLTWLFLLGVMFTWGRGVFCGWACPYGSMTELAFKLREKVGLPEYIVPDRFHRPLRYGRYLVLFGLVAAYLFDAELGERMAEIEPFKSTFYVPPWTRHPGLFAWWGVLLGASFFTWRPFCQYMCPLGATFAIPSYFRFSGPRRRDFCTSCKICTRTCEPRAIDANGVINGADCLNCMECEANYRSDEICPPLVKVRRDAERATAAHPPADLG